MVALASLLHDEAERSAWRYYVADMVWMTARIGYRDQLPRYSEIVNRRNAPVENRSAAQLIEATRPKLGGE